MRPNIKDKSKLLDSKLAGGWGQIATPLSLQAVGGF